MSDIGMKLKTLRKGRKLTQQQVAEAFGVARGTISNHEIGRRAPSIQELQKYADYYGVSLDYFGVQSTSKDELFDILARAKKVFNDENISTEKKEDLYRELMKLYLELERK